MRPEVKTSHGFLHDAQTSRTRLPVLLCEKEGAQPWKALWEQVGSREKPAAGRANSVRE